MGLRLALVLVLFSLAACSGSDAAGPSAADLKGFWVYNHLASGDATTCTETGSIQFEPAASRLTGAFNGRGGCESASLAFDYVKTGVASGQIASGTISFTLTASLETCLYQGKLETATADQVSGSLVCTPTNGEAPRQGSWSMRR